MPLDTSTYALSLLRLDGRRWNELRRIHAQLSVQAAADGSSYFELGNTKVLCTVTGPAEIRYGQGGQPGGGKAAGGGGDGEAKVEVEIGFAGFSGVERRKRRADKRTQELQHALRTAYSTLLLTHLYPHSTISLHLHILSQDGSLLAACINAATLALVDAGVPMTDYLVACTAASSASSGTADGGGSDDPLLDLNGQEELELPFLTVGLVGEQVSVLVLETRVRQERVEGMLAVGVEGCRRMKEILDGVVKDYGKRFAA